MKARTTVVEACRGITEGQLEVPNHLTVEHRDVPSGGLKPQVSQQRDPDMDGPTVVDQGGGKQGRPSRAVKARSANRTSVCAIRLQTCCGSRITVVSRSGPQEESWHRWTGVAPTRHQLLCLVPAAKQLDEVRSAIKRRLIFAMAWNGSADTDVTARGRSWRGMASSPITSPFGRCYWRMLWWVGIRAVPRSARRTAAGCAPSPTSNTRVFGGNPIAGRPPWALTRTVHVHLEHVVVMASPHPCVEGAVVLEDWP